MAKSGSGQMIVKPTADGIAASARAAGRKGPPPVHLWNPPFCGDLDIRIARDGTWFYLGTPIGRQPLVDLFASILKVEEGRFYLVTPVEKVGIRVDDLPLQAVDFDAEGDTLVFRTRTGDSVPLDADHPLRVERDPQTDEPAPAIHVRRGLWARIDRKSFFRLVDLACHAEHDGQMWLGLRSAGQFFPIIPSSELSDTP